MVTKGVDFDSSSNVVIAAAMRVHSALGPGLFEEVYKACLKYELARPGVNVMAEVPLPVRYDGVELKVGYRIDLLVENSLIVELKSVEQFAPARRAQMITYLKLAKIKFGSLLNFNTLHLCHGIGRVAS